MIGIVYRMFGGNANTMWYLYPNIAKRGYMENQKASLGNIKASCAGKRDSNYWKGT